MRFCFLCKQSANKKHDIFTTKVFDDSKLLITLLEELTNSAPLQRDVGKICAGCCGLLNELHQHQKKVTEISERLQSYLSANNAALSGRSQSDAKLRTQDPLAIPEILNFKCHVCFKVFESESDIAGHLRQQHANSKSDKLSDHNASEESILPTTETQFSTANSSSRAKTEIKRANKKRNQQKVYQCPDCPKKWKTSGELKNHLNTHSKVKPFVCEICGQAYKHKSALDVHVGMHNGVCPFICNYCNKSFTQKGALRRHLPIHTGETPYQCESCGKRFIHHTSFKIHCLSHTGQKSYKCDVCGLALLSASHLKRHMRVHTGEKKYACPTCGKRFAERYNLASHQKLHDSPSKSEKSIQKSETCGTFCDSKHRIASTVVPGMEACYSDQFNFQNAGIPKQELM